MRLKVLGSAEDALRAMTEQLIEKMNMRLTHIMDDGTLTIRMKKE